MPAALSGYAAAMQADLLPHAGEFDAVIVGGDHHGIALGSVAASVLGLPLMIVCPRGHGCVISHITAIGECRPDHRYLYVDDWFWGGASRKRAFGFMGRFGRRRIFRYMNQSAHTPIVATYAATQRKYERISNEPT
jgi:DNA-binding transcriptional LysR family regulator